MFLKVTVAAEDMLLVNRKRVGICKKTGAVGDSWESIAGGVSWPAIFRNIHRRWTSPPQSWEC